MCDATISVITALKEVHVTVSHSRVTDLCLAHVTLSIKMIESMRRFPIHCAVLLGRYELSTQ